MNLLVSKWCTIFTFLSIASPAMSEDVVAALRSKDVRLRCGPFDFLNDVSFIWSFGREYDNGSTLNQQNIFLNNFSLEKDREDLSVEIIQSRLSTKTKSSIVKIEQLNETNVGVYRCDALIDGNRTSKVYRVHLFASPKIRKFQKSVYIEDEDADFFEECSATEGVPNNSSIYWQKVKGPAAQKRTNSSILRLKSLQSTDAGIYECVATNGVTDEDRKNITLIVKYKPKVKVIQENLWLLDRTQLKIECKVFAFPEAVVSWTFRNASLPVDVSVVQQSNSFEVGNFHRLVVGQQYVKKTSTVFVPPQAKFSGEYKCEATNEQGESSVIVRVNARPNAIMAISVENSSRFSDACVLKWSLSSGTQIHQYILQIKQTTNTTNYRNHSFVRSSNSVGWSSNRTQQHRRKDMFTVTNLQPNSTYEWRIRAKNVFGESNWSDVFKCQTHSDPQKQYVQLAPNTDYGSRLKATTKLQRSFQRLRNESFKSKELRNKAGPLNMAINSFVILGSFVWIRV
ncbi:hypothetical protein ACOME3_005761 [Neoechinorhynchus agilis]